MSEYMTQENRFDFEKVLMLPNPGVAMHDALEELKRCYERIDYLKSIAEEYRQERPEEYCAKCYAYLSEYDGDGVKECLCSDCEASE